MDRTRDNFIWQYVNIGNLEAINNLKNIYFERKPDVNDFYIPMDIGIKSFLDMKISNPVLIHALPHKSYMIHIDYRSDGQKLALNIPIMNCENSITEFWKCDHVPVYEPPEDSSWRGPIYWNKKHCKKIDEYVMTQPILFNTQVPHSVTNFADKHRLAISLRFVEDPWHLVGL